MKQEFLPDSLLTSYQVGAILQVNPSSVNKWVKDGRIPAFRTPGGHRRIRAADLVSFLRNHQMPIPRSLQGASKRRLLLADDDPKQLEAFGRLLKPHADHIEIALVDNGIDALVQFGALKPHVAVIDVFMPLVDGLEVCRRLKGNQQTNNTRIIVTSGQMTPEIEKKATEAGADMCVPKPLELSLVLAELEATAEYMF